MILADVLRRGHRVAVPWGDNAPYDLIVERKGKLLRVQCKYTKSDGIRIHVHCRSSSEWGSYKYTPDMVDWIVAYDRTTGRCYYVPSKLLGEEGRRSITLRLKRTSNGQKNGTWKAKHFLDF